MDLVDDGSALDESDLVASLQVVEDLLDLLADVRLGMGRFFDAVKYDLYRTARLYDAGFVFEKTNHLVFERFLSHSSDHLFCECAN